jgi:hypothetical protein
MQEQKAMSNKQPHKFIRSLLLTRFSPLSKAPRNDFPFRNFMKKGQIYPNSTMDNNQDKFELGKSRQAVALAKKALSYQKRQTFTNICCIR